MFSIYVNVYKIGLLVLATKATENRWETLLRRNTSLKTQGGNETEHYLQYFLIKVSASFLPSSKAFLKSEQALLSSLKINSANPLPK